MNLYENIRNNHTNLQKKQKLKEAEDNYYNVAEMSDDELFKLFWEIKDDFETGQWSSIDELLPAIEEELERRDLEPEYDDEYDASVEFDDGIIESCKTKKSKKKLKEEDMSGDLYVFSNAESEDKSDAVSWADTYSKEAPNLNFKIHTDGNMYFVDFIGKKEDIKDYLKKLGWFTDEEIEKMNLIKPFERRNGDYFEACKSGSKVNSKGKTKKKLKETGEESEEDFDGFADFLKNMSVKDFNKITKEVEKDIFSKDFYEEINKDKGHKRPLSKRLGKSKDKKSKKKLKEAELPEFCYSVLPSDETKVIAIERDMEGYFPVDIDFPTKEDAKAFIDKENKILGVDEATRNAMEAGSMFGWHVPGANPDTWRKEKPANKLEESANAKKRLKESSIKDRERFKSYINSVCNFLNNLGPTIGKGEAAELIHHAASVYLDEDLNESEIYRLLNYSIMSSLNDAVAEDDSDLMVDTLLKAIGYSDASTNIKESDGSVTVVEQGDKFEFDSMNDAINFWTDCYYNSEGHEQERYMRVLSKLKGGQNFVSDGTDSQVKSGKDLFNQYKKVKDTGKYEIFSGYDEDGTTPKYTEYGIGGEKDYYKNAEDYIKFFNGANLARSKSTWNEFKDEMVKAGYNEELSNLQNNLEKGFRVKLGDSKKESCKGKRRKRNLKETNWVGTIKSGGRLRSKLHELDEDASPEQCREVLDILKTCCEEGKIRTDDEYYQNGFQSVIDDIECIYYDEDLNSSNVDWELDGFYDWCDGAGLFVRLDESCKGKRRKRNLKEGLVMVDTPDGPIFTMNNVVKDLNKDRTADRKIKARPVKVNSALDKPVKRNKKGIKESVYALEPEYGGRNSYYGKALVEINTDGKTLYSYGTPIARIKDGNFELLCDEWALTNTTLRHLREFMQQEGLKPIVRKDLVKMISARPERVNESAKGSIVAKRLKESTGSLELPKEVTDELESDQHNIYQASVNEMALSSYGSYDEIEELFKGAPACQAFARECNEKGIPFEECRKALHDKAQQVVVWAGTNIADGQDDEYINSISQNK